MGFSVLHAEDILAQVRADVPLIIHPVLQIYSRLQVQRQLSAQLKGQHLGLPVDFHIMSQSSPGADTRSCPRS